MPFSLPNATYLIHLWGEKNKPLGVITLGPRQAHLMRPWLTLATTTLPISFTLSTDQGQLLSLDNSQNRDSVL
jgi:hypothetical protein